MYLASYLKFNNVSHPTLFLVTRSLVTSSQCLFHQFIFPRLTRLDNDFWTDTETQTNKQSMTQGHLFKSYLTYFHTPTDIIGQLRLLFGHPWPLIGWCKQPATLIVASGLEKIEVPQSAAACSICDSVLRKLIGNIGAKFNQLLGHIRTPSDWSNADTPGRLIGH